MAATSRFSLDLLLEQFDQLRGIENFMGIGVNPHIYFAVVGVGQHVLAAVPVPARIDVIPDHLLDLGEFSIFLGPLLRGQFIVVSLLIGHGCDPPFWHHHA